MTAPIYIPLKAGTKKPPLVTGWTTDPPPTMVIAPENNQALRLDSPRVDVDLDCPEARAAAEVFLLKTGLKHGRPSVGVTHHWYVSEDAVYEAFFDVVKVKDEDGDGKDK